MTPSIIIDDTSAELSFQGKQWQSGSDSSTYGGSYTVCRTGLFRHDGRSPSKLAFSFIGTGVELYGQASTNLTLNYTLDASSPREADLTFTPGIPGKTGVKLWEIRDVTPALHTISIIPTDGESILDYIVVHPASAMPLNGKTLVVDDRDAMIEYSGSWTASDSDTRYPAGLSYNSTRSGMRTARDSFRFQFVGSSVAVYGLLNQVDGKLASTYAIDGGTATRHVAYDGSQLPDSNARSLHQRFFFEKLVPGNHTLMVTVEEATGSQTFWLDYVTFGGTSGTRLALSSSSPSIMMSSSSSSSNPFSSSSSSHSKLNTIIGIAVVVVIFFSIVFCCCRNRLRQRMFFWIAVSRTRRRGSIYMPSHVQHAPPAPLHQPLMAPASSFSPYTSFAPTHPLPAVIPPRVRTRTPTYAPAPGPLPSPSLAPAPAPASATTTTAPARSINSSSLARPASGIAATAHAHSPVQDAELPPPYSLTDQSP